MAAQPALGIDELALGTGERARAVRQIRRSPPEMADVNLEGQTRSLADLVKYQTEAVVSRSLLSKATGSVTLFAFDEDQSLSEHTTPYDALALALEGELEITMAGECSRLAPGEVLLMPANRPHAVRAIARSKMLLVMVRG